MKRFSIGVGIVLVLIVAILFLVPPLIPVQTYRDEIKARFLAATGRELSVNGDISLSLIPSIALTADNVVVANAPGAPSKEFAKIKRLDFGLRLMPLLSGEIDVKRLVLVEPTVNLETTKQGKPNWTFAPEGPSTDNKRVSKPKKTSGAPKPAGRSSASRLHFGEIRIENGTLNYRTGRRVQSYRNINVTLTGSSTTKPVTVDGSLSLRGKPLKFEVSIATPASLRTKKGARIVADIKTAALKASLRGHVRSQPEITASGIVSVDVPSVSGLMAWVAKSTKINPDAPKRIKLTSSISVTPKKVSLTRIKLTVDKVTSDGNLTVLLGAKPTIQGKANFAALDLNPYLGKATPGRKASSPSSPPRSSKKGNAAASRGWSTAPIDLSFLHAFNLDYEIDAKNLRVGGAKVDRANIRAKLVNGVLALTIKQLKLYKGTGTGVLDISTRGKSVTIAPRLSLKGVSAYPLLHDVAGIERLEGTGNLAINVKGRGRSQRDIISTLAGTLSFKFTDGAIRGINIAEMIRSVSPGALSRGFDPAKKTDFASFTASFTGRKGTFATKDLQLLAPLLRMSGTGHVLVLPRRLDMLLKPKLVGTIKGQKSAFARAGVTIPVKVRGPWDNPTFQPDLSAIAKDALKNPSKIKDLGEKLRKSNPKDILKNILPGSR